jgi:predicted dienelactone hydrolase
MGPSTLRVAIQGPPDAKFKGLILLSHGNRGSELGHSSLAEALAQDGYLVAALRHPGDNWQYGNLLQASPLRYFIERPQHVSRVIDALMQDSAWGERIAKDSAGPRIGAIGHSAGGCTVLALAGGESDLPRISAYCQAQRGDDPIFLLSFTVCPMLGTLHLWTRPVCPYRLQTAMSVLIPRALTAQCSCSNYSASSLPSSTRQFANMSVCRFSINMKLNILAR